MRYLWLLLALSSIAYAAYQPELMLTTAADTLNKQISQNFGKNISEAINKFPIPDQHFQQKVSGANVKFNLAKIKQNITINWKGNLLHVMGVRSFRISSKNVNLTLHGDLDVKIGVTRRQKGPLKVIVQNINTNTTVDFLQSECVKGLGFNAQVSNVDVHTSSISVKIEGHAFDNFIIKEVQRFLLPRLPELINNAIKTQVNPLIAQNTCKRPQEIAFIGDQYYIATVNSTKVPEFDLNLKYLRIPIDVTLQNQMTNQTHEQLQKDDLPSNQFFQGEADFSMAASSNFLNMVTWLVNDAHLLHVNVTNSMLGPDPVIALNTTNLSILLPGLKKWPNKEVVLLIKPALQYEHLFVRSGRGVTLLSLSVQFVVNQSSTINDTQRCIAAGQCIVACNLNLTLSASLTLRIKQKLVKGLIQRLSIAQVGVIDSKINVNTQGLKSILNSIVGSAIPGFNNQLGQTGIPLPQKITQLLAKFDISDIHEQTFQDFVAFGLVMDI